MENKLEISSKCRQYFKNNTRINCQRFINKQDRKFKIKYSKVSIHDCHVTLRNMTITNYKLITSKISLKLIVFVDTKQRSSKIIISYH